MPDRRAKPMVRDERPRPMTRERRAMPMTPNERPTPDVTDGMDPMEWARQRRWQVRRAGELLARI